MNDVNEVAWDGGWLDGGHVATPQPLRTREEIAVDNAAEGCGRELFGALANAVQARTAANPHVRRAMRFIARDELTHAGFSFALAEALSSRLTLPQRRRAREAQELAWSRIAPELSDAAQATLGLMDGDQLRGLAAALQSTARI